MSTVDPNVDDLYAKYKKLQKQLEFLKVQEEYIKDEQKNLKKELLHAQEEVKRIQSVPLVIGQFLEAVDQNTGIVGSTTGWKLYKSLISHITKKKKEHLRVMPMVNEGKLTLHVLIKSNYRNFRSFTCTADYPHRPIIAYGEKKSQQITRTGG